MDDTNRRRVRDQHAAILVRHRARYPRGVHRERHSLQRRRAARHPFFKGRVSVPAGKALWISVDGFGTATGEL